MEGLRIRDASLSDSNAIADIDSVSFPPAMVTLRDAIKRFIETHSPDQFLHILELEDGQSMGFIGFSLDHRNAASATVWNIAIHLRYRGEGFGSILLKHLERTAWSCGMKSLQRYVSSANENALKFYGRFGFLKKKTLERYYPDETNAFVMKKNLDGTDPLPNRSSMERDKRPS